MPLRPHQQRFNEICKGIKSGLQVNEIFVFAVPGSGKSLFPAIASQLITNDNIKILWICPRDSLITQAEKGFRGDDFFDVGNMDIRAAKNNGDIFRGNQGVVTSYQSIIARPERWIKISEDYKLILFLDEFDSLTDYSEWSRPITKMYKNAILRIPATGTIDRSDNIPISFVPYLSGGDIDFTETNTRKWIIYDNEQALNDNVIVPFDAVLINGSGSYIDKDNITRNFHKFTGSGDELLTAFSTDFAYQMFEASINRWNEYRVNHPWAKMLVISNSIKIAKKYTQWFKDKGYRFDIATSEDSPGCKEVISRFKIDNSHFRALDGIVTVSVAYKGLDIKAAVFLTFLTRIRGKAWCTQAIGRIQRAYPCKEKGIVFAPDDPKLRSVLKKMGCNHIDAADGAPPEKSTPSENLNPGNYNNGITALESEAHINGFPLFRDIPEVKESQSEKETRLRSEINSVINKIVGSTNAGNRKIKSRLFWLRVKQIVNNGRDNTGKLIRKKLDEMTVRELEKVNEFCKNYK